MLIVQFNSSTHTCMFLHPDVLQNPDVRFSPKYDYYALGVLFIEIVLWQRIEDVLCKHQSLQKKICLPQDALKIRGILLNEPADQDENYLREVAFQAGDRCSEVVEICLTGAFGRSLSEKALVAAFDNRVVHQLQSCVT